MKIYGWGINYIALLLVISTVLINPISTSQELDIKHIDAAGITYQRFRRQTTSNQLQDTPPGSPGTVSRDPNDNNNGIPNEEALTSLKCDFGTSDIPDLCKFSNVETFKLLGTNGQSNWVHGSGRLALFQGGPLIDASDRNDTAGGYVFFETSNSFVANLSMLGSGQIHQNPANQLYDSVFKSLVIDKQSKVVVSKDRSPSEVKIRPHRKDPTTSTFDKFQYVSSGGLVVGPIFPTVALVSPNLTSPGPSGMCLSFQYAISGLSADEMRIYVNDHKIERSRLIWTSSESAGGNWTKGEVLYSATNLHSIMFAVTSSSPILKDPQQRKFRGYIALDEVHISKHDAIDASETTCKAHCNFDGDLCGWTNAENGQEDDFDWSFGRGSYNLFTGPARDYSSSTNDELTGSYIYTDSSFPRRPGDRATLISTMFQPTPVNDAMCLRLSVHMFGSGIGSLAIKIRYADEPSRPTAANAQSSPTSGSSSVIEPGKVNSDLVIWEMSGDAGNSWHQAQTSVSSSKTPFQVLIEGVIGENHLGDIAIDEISFSSGPCPTSPPVASKNYGDCTFEQSICYWRNPDREIHLDDLDWIRLADEQSIHGPNFDHTLKKRSGSYIKLENTFKEPKSGSRAFLLSPIFQPKASGAVQCLSFYYYMFMRSISSSGPNLGTIRVYLASNNELVPVWRLTNPISSPIWKHARVSLSSTTMDSQPVAPTKLFQIAFEGIWGDAQGGAIALDDITVFDGACDILPLEAKSIPGECTFDVDLCTWVNKTSQPISMGSMLDTPDGGKSPFLQSVNSVAGNTLTRLAASSKPSSWQLATVDSRPANLQDHTYKSPIGYIFAEVLDVSARPLSFTLQGMEMTVPPGQVVTQCLSFWFSCFGRQELNQLNVYVTQASAPPSLTQDSGQVSPSGPSRNNAAISTSNQLPSITNNNQNPMLTSSSVISGDSDLESTNAWKNFEGKLIWSIRLRNITEVNRRKWQYGQVSVKADSNHIVRFVASSSDGGFALDDLSYYDGACETRPVMAKVQSEDEPDANPIMGPPKASA